jgi:ribosome-associated protein
MEPLRVNARLVIPAEELKVSFARSGGPGGQNVNKVETKVSLRFDVRGSHALGDWRRAMLLERIGSRLTSKGELLVHASRYRERKRNLEDARERLAGILGDGLQPRRTRKPTRATRGSKERRLAAKKHRGKIKRDRGRADHD